MKDVMITDKQRVDEAESTQLMFLPAASDVDQSSSVDNCFSLLPASPGVIPRALPIESNN